ncbi:MAG: helix-turn-helix domain-containing protein [Candidatus Saccharimonas sp.]
MDQIQTETTLATIKKAGLTESQAKGYLALIEHGNLTPTELATHTGENRTNAYMICDKLVTLGLATRKEGPKATYTPNHPTALEALAERRRRAVQRNEQEVKSHIDPIINLFYAATEMPGARTVQGVEGIKEVFADILKVKQDVYFIRTSVDAQSLPSDFYINHSSQRAKAGITTYALTPVAPSSIRNFQQGNDKTNMLHRTFYNPEDYTAPAEIQIYGNTIALIAYGETQMATIITSPPLAEAMKQLFRMIMSSLQAYSDGIKATHPAV